MRFSSSSIALFVAASLAACSSRVTSDERDLEVVVDAAPAALYALARAGDGVAALRSDGVARVDPSGVTWLAGPEYRSCPDAAGHDWLPALGASFTEPRSAVDGSTVVLASEACGGIWARDLDSGAVRVLAPLAPDGAWPGRISSPAITVEGGRVTACVNVSGDPEPEVWSLDLASGARVRLGSIPAEGADCEAVLADEGAAYVVLSSQLWVLERGGARPARLSQADVDAVAADADALYLAHDGRLERVEKRTRTATTLAANTGAVFALSVEAGRVYASGLGPDAEPIFWSIPVTGGAATRLRTFDRDPSAWAPWVGEVIAAGGYAYLGLARRPLVGDAVELRQGVGRLRL